MKIEKISRENADAKNLNATLEIMSPIVTRTAT